jgi:hypothetical protein
MTRDELRKAQAALLTSIISLQNQAEEVGMERTVVSLDHALTTATQEYADLADPEKNPTIQVKAIRG